MPTPLFAYGVLMYPPAQRALTGRAFPHSPGILTGYRRYALKMTGYSRIAGIVAEQADATVPGVLLYKLDKHSMGIFDAFENVHAGLYQRQEVIVINANKQPVEAQTYVLGKRARRFIDGDWDQTDFERRFLRRYYYRIIPKFVRSLQYLQGD